MTRLRIRFSGHVQGVGFRATARSIAGRSPVTGWVRNEPDRTVLMEVQGMDAEITAMLDSLRRRMQGMIASESTERIPAVDDETGFSVRR